jgi:hypothetical protein
LPDDSMAGRRAKVIRLTKRLQKIRDSMIRRKQRTERLRRDLRLAGNADYRTWVRIERNEARYQVLVRSYIAAQARLKTLRIGLG